VEKGGSTYKKPKKKTIIIIIINARIGPWLEELYI
jgi:hypothetical protein